MGAPTRRFKHHAWHETTVARRATARYVGGLSSRFVTR